MLVGSRELLERMAADAEEGEAKHLFLLVPAAGRSLLWFFQIIMSFHVF